MAGESVQTLGDWFFKNVDWVAFPNEIVENILREGMAGKFDPLPMKQAREYAKGGWRPGWMDGGGMTEYIGEHVDATVNDSGERMSIMIGWDRLSLTRDEAYELQSAVNAVIGAMAFDGKAAAK